MYTSSNIDGVYGRGTVYSNEHIIGGKTAKHTKKILILLHMIVHAYLQTRRVGCAVLAAPALHQRHTIARRRPTARRSARCRVANTTGCLKAAVEAACWLTRGGRRRLVAGQLVWAVLRATGVARGQTCVDVRFGRATSLCRVAA